MIPIDKNIADLENSFVNDYEEFNRFKETVNSFFKSNKIDFKYTYDDFCKEMLDILHKYNAETLSVMIFPILLKDLVVNKLPKDFLDDSKINLNV